MSTPPRVVHEFEAPRGVIRTSLSEFSGKTYVDLRLWVEPRNEPGAALIPTKRGLSLPLDYLPELTEALEAIGDAIKREHGELASRRRGPRVGQVAASMTTPLAGGPGV